MSIESFAFLRRFKSLKSMFFSMNGFICSQLTRVNLVVEDKKVMEIMLFSFQELLSEEMGVCVYAKHFQPRCFSSRVYDR
jgi:hypothetical protein